MVTLAEERYRDSLSTENYGDQAMRSKLPPAPKKVAPQNLAVGLHEEAHLATISMCLASFTFSQLPLSQGLVCKGENMAGPGASQTSFRQARS